MPGGSKKPRRPTLKDLNRGKWEPSEHGAHVQELLSGPDRVVALMGCAWLDEELTAAVANALHLWDGNARSELFERDGAPLSTMASRVLIGRALKLYDEESHRSFTVIRRVRNAFAHLSRPITFTTQAVAAECLKLPDVRMTFDDDAPLARVLYVSNCLLLIGRLFKDGPEPTVEWRR